MKQSIGRAFLFFLVVLVMGKCCNALEACYGTKLSTEFVFNNSKTVTQYYALQKSGAASTWATLTPVTFALEPGESRVVVAFIRVPKKIPEGVYDLIVKAATSDGVIEESVGLSVGSCHAVRIVLDEASFDGCINKELVIPLTIKNYGTYLEDISLSTTKGVLGVDSLSLNKDESQIVNLYFKR